MNTGFQRYLPDEEAQLAFGASLASVCQAPLVLALEGDLGAGKTTLVRGFMRGLGYKDKVKSPSYTLVEAYELPSKTIFHFDFYRITDPEELDFIGIQEYAASHAILLLEWPEKAGSRLPAVDVVIHLSLNESGRDCELAAKTERGARVISALSTHL